eukprot:TRINITY_DN3962_c0_g1_i2.p1 TRINITY_DN3962_c0_g1~~TRINITY_DN3962_c0_g1_i2.p1  ORF type:complete len:208 (-),score=65.05 TRINITY_DN3962_c0_g1_i2:64-687(-)
MLILGFALICVGFKLFKIAIFFGGLIAGGGITYILLEEYTELDDWIIWIISGVVGLISAFLAFFVVNLGLFLLGAMLGVVIASIIQGTVSGGLITSEVGIWCFVAIIALLCGALTVILKKPVIIFGTSILGSFAVIASISYFGNCNEFMRVIPILFEDFSQYDDIELNTVSWILLGLGGALTVFGVLLQFLVTSKDNSEKKMHYTLV